MDNNTFAHREKQPEPEHALHKWIEDAYDHCAQKKDHSGADFADNVCEFAKTASLYLPGPPGRIASATLYAADEINLRDDKYAACDMVCGALKGVTLRLVSQSAFGEVHPLIQGATLGLASRLSDVAFTRNSYSRPGGEGFDAFYGLQNISAELMNRPALTTDIASFTAASALSKLAPVARGRFCLHLGTTISGATYGFMNGASKEINSEREKHQSIDWTSVAKTGFSNAVLDGSAATVGYAFGNRFGGKYCIAPRAIEVNRSFGKTTWDTNFPHSGNGSSATTDIERQELRLLDKLDQQLDFHQSAEVTDAFIGIRRRNTSGDLHHDTISQIYNHAERLLEPSSLIPQLRGSGPLLAKQILMQVAEPHLVHQGNHPTCTVAALEHRLYSRDPEKATDLIVQAATTASYKPPYAYNGKEITVQLDPQSMIAEHTCIDPFGADGKHRSYASHILQYVTPNIHWQAQDPNIRYERATKAREFTLRDFGKQRPELLHDYPHLGPGDTTSIYEAITGNGTRCHWGGNNFRTREEFKQKLVDAKQQQQFPLLMSVDVRHTPFYDLLGASTKGKLTDSDHTHDICVTDFDSKNRIVSVYNSWGRQSHPSGISLEALYKALERNR
jgi:hypothetical protein